MSPPGRIRAGVVGRPIAHSLSPLIHGAWIAAAGLDAAYEAYGPEDEAAFDALVARGRAGALAGLNVTAPYKARALALADAASATATACDAANLLIFRNGRVHADSTDGAGLLAALAEQAPDLDLAGAKVVLLGAGGAARAAAAALTGAGGELVVINRSPDRARTLVEAVGGRVGAAGDLAGAGLVVNALTVQPDLDLTVLKPGAVVMDMTYRPLITPLLAAARAQGLTVVDGLSMLIGQARPSFQALFGRPAPDMDVRALALAALAEAER